MLINSLKGNVINAICANKVGNVGNVADVASLRCHYAGLTHPATAVDTAYAQTCAADTSA